MAQPSIAVWNGRDLSFAGTDVFYNGGDGDERIDGTADADRLGGMGGADTVYGGAGDDVLFGYEAVFNADLPGPDGNDELHGGDGHDALRGNNGDDRLYGDAGNDALRGDAGSDRIDGGAGIDLASFRYDTQSLAAGVVLDASATGGPGEVTIADGLGGTDTLIGIESVLVIGTDFGDSLTGGAGGDALIGFDGADLLRGNAGADTLGGDGGDDTLVGGSQAAGTYDVADYRAASGAVTVDLAAGTASGLGSDVLTGIEGAIGSAYGDQLSGGSAGLAQWFEGGDGNDTILGGGGLDTASWSGASGAVVVALLTGRADGAAGTDSLEGIEALEGSAWADDLGGDGAANRLRGAAGDDTLRGGAGADTLDGGTGADRLAGGTGDDSYRVDAGDTVVESTTPSGGRDTILSAVAWVLGTGCEDLELTGTAMVGGLGNGAANRITGNAAGNAMRGAGGNDTLNGRGGNDLLVGGAGADTLLGGAGSDLFRFDEAPAGGVDRIADFAAADDTVQLAAAAFAGIGAAGALGAARFRAGAVALDADDRILYDAASGVLRFDADGSGAAKAVVFATVLPGTALGAADFVIL